MVNQKIANLPETEQHRVLADELRRYVVEILGATRGPTQTTVGELASDIDRATTTWDRQELLVQLHHVHLPMLDDFGIVTYTPETRRIRLEGFAVAGAIPR